MYSVDFDIGTQYAGRPPSAANFLVTATHALFIGNGKQSTAGKPVPVQFVVSVPDLPKLPSPLSSPVAVVGIQFRYMVLHEFFLNTTGKFNVPCTYMDNDCYLIDNNGFVVLSNHRVGDVGRFFGLVDGDILNELVTGGVFRKIRMFDYQAICLDPESEATAPSTSPFFFSLLDRLFRFTSHIITTLATLYINAVYGNWNIEATTLEPQTSEPNVAPFRHNSAPNSDAAGGAAPNIVGYEPFYNANRTRARACDKQFDLFEMMDFSNLTRTQEITCGQNAGCTRLDNFVFFFSCAYA